MRKTNKLLDICETIEKMCDKDDLIANFMDNISYVTSAFIFSAVKEWRYLQKDNILSEIELQEQFQHFKEGLQNEINIYSTCLQIYIDKLENIYIKKDRLFISDLIKQIKKNLPKEADEIDEDFNNLIKDIGGFND